MKKVPERTFVEKTLDFLVFGNFMIAFAVVSQAALTIVFAGLQNAYPLLLSLFLSAFIIYNFHRYCGLSSLKQEQILDRHQWSSDHKKIMKLILYACLSVLAFCLWFVSFNSMILMGFLGLISLIYSIPVLPFSRIKKLRDMPYAKGFIVSTAVTLVVVGIPFLESEGWSAFAKSSFMLIFTERWFYILAITLPFDIRDMSYDKTYHIKTIPLSLGVKPTKALSVFALFLFAFICTLDFSMGWGMEQQRFIAFIISAILAVFPVIKASEHSGPRFYPLYLEGCLLMQYLLVHGSYMF